MSERKMKTKLGNKCPRTRRSVYAECRAAEKAQRTSGSDDEVAGPRDQPRDNLEVDCGCAELEEAGDETDAGRLVDLSAQSANGDFTTHGRHFAGVRCHSTKSGAVLQREKISVDIFPQNRGSRLVPHRSPTDDEIFSKSSQPSNVVPSSHSIEKPPQPPYSWLDIIFSIISIVSYLADIGSDCWLVYLYYTHQKWWYCGLTLAFIIIPGLIVTIFSLAWYIEDHKQDKCLEGSDLKTPVHPVHWVSRFMLLLFQLGPVMRYIEAVVYGWWSRPKKSDQEEEDKKIKQLWYKMMLYEDTDSCLLRLIECFMESAPQLVLQLYILITYGKQIGSHDSTILVIVQAVACVTALGSMSWALASYHRALRCSLENKANMSYKAMTMQCVWRFFTIGSRVLALALFASAFSYFVFVAVAGHWIAMFIWILILNTDFCHSKCKEIFFNIVMAAVYIFCYVNLKEGHTRLRYIFFYTLMYIENTGLLLGWYLVSNTEESWRIKLSMVVILLGFFIGILFQCLYYLLCHPNNTPPWDKKTKIKHCIPFVVLWPTLCNLASNQTQDEECASLNKYPHDVIDTTDV